MGPHGSPKHDPIDKNLLVVDQRGVGCVDTETHRVMTYLLRTFMALRLYKGLCYFETLYSINSLVVWALYGTPRVTKSWFNWIKSFGNGPACFDTERQRVFHWKIWFVSKLSTFVALRIYKRLWYVVRWCTINRMLFCGMFWIPRVTK